VGGFVLIVANTSQTGNFIYITVKNTKSSGLSVVLVAVVVAK